MTPQQPNVSVIEPLSPAIERVKTILFKPFDLGKWFVIGFCAWLAYISKGGGGGSGGRNFQRGVEPGQAFHQAKDFILDNLSWLIPVAVIVVMLMIILWLVITWLSSRGRFMFLHCVAENKAEVKVPWTKFQQHANSLFLFRIVLGIISFLVVALFCLIALLLVFFSRANLGFNVFSILGIILSALLFIAVSIVFLLVHKFTTDFVVPIMFLRTTSCTDGWREFLTILAANKARFALYILFQIVISITIGAIIFAAAIMTCCCAACILAIPYIGTVLMLPLLIFKRAYSLCYLRQFGPSFDVFSPEIETT